MSATQEFKEFASKGNVIDLVVGKLDFSSLFWVLGEVPRRRRPHVGRIALKVRFSCYAMARAMRIAASRLEASA